MHRFFEGLIPYLDKPEDVSSWQVWDFDNFKFIIHELFLYAVAALLKYECFPGVEYLVLQHYYVGQNARRGKETMVPYSIFQSHLRCFDCRNQHLKQRRLSLHADMLEQRTKSSGITLQQMMQADFIMFIRYCIDSLRSEVWQRWLPVTLLYAHRQYGPFEVFARSQSMQYFEKVRPIFDVERKEDILPLVDAFREGKLNIPRWEFGSFDPFQLMAFDKLATLP